MKDADLAQFELKRELVNSEEGEKENSDTAWEALPDGEGPVWPLHTCKVFDKAEGRGQLIVSRGTLTLTTKTSRRSWQYSHLEEIRKIDDVDSDSTLKNLKHLHSRSAEALHFHFLAGSSLTIILHPADRDRVFNLVLAWSGLKWQCLQMERQNKMDSDRSNLDRAIKRAFH